MFPGEASAVSPDWTLHMLVPARESLFPAVVAALEGGVTVIQLRDKDASDRKLYAVGGELLRLCRQAGAAFLVNDRPDVAMLLGADGIHLGQEDLPPEVVRRILPKEMYLGVSTHTADQAALADRVADYVAFGPVFGTRSKENPDPPTGVDALAQVCRACRKPVVAIGGVTPANKDLVWGAGAAGTAVIGAILGAADPRAAARSLLPPSVT